MIYSGNVLEIEIYPTSKQGLRIPNKKEEPGTPDAQKMLNIKNSKKHFHRLVECNFTENDIFMTLTYKQAPKEIVEFKRDIKNFIRRLKYQCKKNNLPEPKYMTISHADNKQRMHHHLILNNYSWDFIKEIWKKGRVRISNLIRDTETSFKQISEYLTSEKNENIFNKRWNASKNLKKPIVKYKELKRLNIYRSVIAPKGYKVISVESKDNIYTGIHQYIKCVKIAE